MNKVLPKHFEAARRSSLLAGKYAAASRWAMKTLVGYLSGMSKFFKLKGETTGIFDKNQPISDQDINNFSSWAGGTNAEKETGPDKVMLLVTIKKYLDGIHAWHIVRHTLKPEVDKEVVSDLLSTTKRNKEE